MLKTTMNVLNILIILSALLSGSAADLTARAQSSPLSRIEKSVAGREPGWKLKRWRITRNNKVALYEWVSSKRYVSAVVEMLESPEEAAKPFKERPGGWAAEDAGVRVLDLSAHAVGEESNLIESEYDKDRGIVFRKRRVIVRVSASSLELAERFAAYIADTIPAA
jgi:hypothetical protein